MGESIVSCSKWTVLAVCLSFTLGYIIEHLYLSPAAMPWFIYFKSLRTELVEEQARAVSGQSKQISFGVSTQTDESIYMRADKALSAKRN